MFTTGDVMKARSYSYRSVYNEFQVMDCFRIIYNMYPVTFPTKINIACRKRELYTETFYGVVEYI